MLKRLASLVGALLLGPVAADAQAVTYDFSASTFGGSGYGYVGGIYGTLTFDFSDANPALTRGAVGSQLAPWSVTATGRSLFTMNLWSDTTGRLIYSSGSPKSATIDGMPTEERGYTRFGADESNRDGSSNITIYYEPPSPGFMRDGLPLTTDVVDSIGEIFTPKGGFDFQLTKLTRAPEIDPASAVGGLTLLLGSLLVLRSRRPSNPIAA